MPTPSKHALLSASSAYRWLECTAAPHFEAKFPEGESVYAEEGTLAHEICELYARSAFSSANEHEINQALDKLKRHPLYSEEMLRTAEIYVNYLQEKAMSFPERPHVVTEVQVNLSAYIPEGFGTCDCVMIGGDTLHITDYKHGKGVSVSAVGNPQMRLYALGALQRYGAVYGSKIKRVSMGICQPRLSEYASEDELTVEELLAWGERIRPIAREAFDGPGRFCPGEHCRFCKGKAQCRARAMFFAGFGQYTGRDIAGKLSAEVREKRLADGEPLLSDEEVGVLLEKAAGLTAWYSDLQNYATDTLLSGRSIPGYKLVEGRSNRAFSDQDAAFRTLLDAGYDEALLYDRKARTLSELEKMLGKKTFGELLSGFVTKPRGKPTLVPASDRREPYNLGAAEFGGGV